MTQRDLPQTDRSKGAEQAPPELTPLERALEHARIDHIVIVDDDVPDLAPLEDTIQQLDSPPRSLPILLGKPWPKEPELRYEWVGAALDAETFDRRRKLIRGLYEELQRDYSGPDGILPELIQRLRDRNSPFPVLAIGPREWEMHGRRLDTLAEATRVPLGSSPLILFDMNLRNAGKGENAGLELARRYVSDFTDSAICGIISGFFREGHLSADAKKYLGDETSDRDRYVLVAKETLNDDPARFAFQIARAVTAPDAAKFRQNTELAIKLAHEEALQKVRDLDLDVFLYSVVHRSAEEGLGGFETLSRLSQVAFAESLMGATTTKADLQRILGKLRSMVPEWEWDVPSSVFEEKHRELYKTATLVNSSLLPIQSGDIFELQSPGEEKRRRYVLVMQPCDLMLREDGHRQVRDVHDVNVGVLLSIRKEKIKKRSMMPGFLLPAYSDPDGDGVRRDKLVDFRPETYVPLHVLDLCAYSQSGEASITPSTPEAKATPEIDQLPSSLRARYEVLDAWARRVVASATMSASKTVTTTPSALLEVPLGACEAVRGRVEKGTLSYECKRVGRIDSALATDLLLEFKRYSSRTAHAMDLAGNLKDRENEEARSPNY